MHNPFSNFKRNALRRKESGFILPDMITIYLKFQNLIAHVCPEAGTNSKRCDDRAMKSDRN